MTSCSCLLLQGLNRSLPQLRESITICSVVIRLYLEFFCLPPFVSFVLHHLSSILAKRALNSKQEVPDENLLAFNSTCNFPFFPF